MTETLAKTRPRARPAAQIDDPELARVVARIVERFDPVAVYLFGSRARGNADPESDYDLMVVVPDDMSRETMRERAIAVREDCRVPMDLVPTLARSFVKWRNQIGMLTYEVNVDGVRLYPPGREPIALELAPSPKANVMNREVVDSWLRRVDRDLRTARLCSGDLDPLPDQAAYHIQQAAEKLAKAALVAHEIRTRKGHLIEGSAERLPTNFPDRDRFLALKRFSIYVWAFRYPEEDLPEPPPPEPSVAEVRGWIAEIESLKADFERWLAERD